jgi:hypothetical protein
MSDWLVMFGFQSGFALASYILAVLAIKGNAQREAFT